jgi:ABC-2 type transport system permease protein
VSAIWAIAAKDLRLLARDRLGLFWSLGFPLLFAALLSGVSSRDAPPRLGVGLVDGGGPRALLEALVAHPVLAAAPVEGGLEPVGRGERLAIVTVAPGHVEVATDPSRPAEGVVVEALVARTVVDTLAATSDLPRVTRVDVRAGSAPGRALDLAFPAAMLWAVLGCAASFAVSLVVERTRGTALRVRLAPPGRAGHLAGKALAALAACVAVMLVILLVGHLAAGLRVASLALLGLAALSTAVGFVGLTLFLASLGRSERAVAGATWGAFLPMALVGGAMVPVSVMPPWLAALSVASPVRWAIVALEGASWRGHGLFDLLVPCGLLVGLGALAFALGLWRLARLDARAP